MVDYALQFREHLSQIRAHLNGSHDNFLSPSISLLDDESDNWSPEEKNRFFHGIAVHSRFRPDLISPEIGTKSIIDVCVYIDMLDKASSLHPPNVQLREELEGAMEVSDPFIDWEEEQASALIDDQWADPLYEDSVTLDTVMSRLDKYYLKAMESILRNIDDPLAGEDGATVQPNSDNKEGQLLSDIQSPPDSQLPTVAALSNQVSRDENASKAYNAPAGAAERALESNFVLVHALGDTQLCEATRLSVAKEGREGSANPLTRELSPASRRRQQKRLYMRRKRAEARGETVNDAVEKLRPGRKLKLKAQKAGRPRTYNTKKRRLLQEEIVDSDFESEGIENDQSVHSSAPPKTTPEQQPVHANTRSRRTTKANKVKSYLIRCGLTRQCLEDAGLDFFNLSRLSQLVESSSTEAISAETTRLMKAVVAEFITEVLHHSVVLFEQDVRMKGDIKVWRTRANKELSVDHVARAVEMTHMNSDWPSSSEASNNNICETNLSSHKAGRGDAESEIGLADRVGSSLSEEEVPTKFALPLHRQLYLPLVILPRHRIDYTQPQHLASEEDLMPSDIDEDLLLQEMENEDYVDRRDMMVASSYESDIWNQIRSR